MGTPQPVRIAAPLEVVGVCGQTVYFLVNGAVVSFTCQPPPDTSGVVTTPGAGPEPSQPGPAPIQVPEPGTLKPPYVATLIDTQNLDELLLDPKDINLDLDALVVNVRPGYRIASEDLTSTLAEARAQGRVVRLEIEEW